MKTKPRHHRRRHSSSAGNLRIDDGRVAGMDECRVVFTSDDGTVIGVDDGREVFQSKMHAGFKTVLQVLAMALLLFIGIPIGMILVDLSLKVLAWGRH